MIRAYIMSTDGNCHMAEKNTLGKCTKVECSPQNQRNDDSVKDSSLMQLASLY